MTASPHRSDLVAALVRLERLREESAGGPRCRGCEARREAQAATRIQLVAAGRHAAFGALVLWVGGAAFVVTASLGLMLGSKLPGLVPLLGSGLAFLLGWLGLERLGGAFSTPQSGGWRAWVLVIIALCAIAPLVLGFDALSMLGPGE
jgi:hypothetical protein